MKGKKPSSPNKNNLFYLLKTQKIKTSKNGKIKANANVACCILTDMYIVTTSTYVLPDPLLCIRSFANIIKFCAYFYMNISEIYCRSIYNLLFILSIFSLQKKHGARLLK